MGAVAVALLDHLRDMRVRIGLAVLLVVLLVSLRAMATMTKAEKDLFKAMLGETLEL